MRKDPISLGLEREFLQFLPEALEPGGGTSDGKVICMLVVLFRV